MRKIAIALAVALSFQPLHAEEPEQTLAALTVNEKFVTSAEVITKDGEHVILSKARWRELGVTFDEDIANETPLSSRDLGVVVVFHEDTQSYSLTIPPNRRPIQRFGNGRPINTNVSPSPRGVMIGYDLGVYTNGGKVEASLAHDLRSNIAAGVLHHTGSLGNEGYQRGLTTWSKDLYKQGLRVQVGDVFTSPRNPSLNSSVNLGGVRIGSDRSLVSEAMYPVPIIGGLADTRSTAEILINDGKGQKQSVDPGPFQFDQLHLPGGLSDISVITRDATGRETLTTRQFYTMPNMVRKGAIEWDVELGLVRQGNAGDTYGKPAAVGQISYGLRDNWTLSAGVQTTGEKTNVSVGSIVSMGRAGAVTVDVAKSDDGHAYTVAYERRHRDFSVAASHTAYSEDYWQLAHERGGSAFKPKSLTTFSAGYGRDNWRGDVTYSNSSSYTDKDDQTRVGARFRYDMNSANTLSLSAGKNLTTGETTAAIGWQYRFGANMTASTSVQFAPVRQATASLSGSNLVRNVPVGWQVGSDGKRHYASARADFSRGTVSADISTQSARVGLEGGVWVGEGGVIATRKPYGSFIVAEVEGTQGAAVGGTGTVSKTNKRGFAVISNTPGLYEQPITVDSDSVPLETQLDSQTFKVVAPRGGGAKALFKVMSESMRTYQVFVNDAPLKDGGEATSDAETVIVGEDGYMVLMAPKEGQSLLVTKKDGSCTAVLPSLPKTAVDIARIDCKENKS
jgi:outer membrane usher protein